MRADTIVRVISDLVLTAGMIGTTVAWAMARTEVGGLRSDLRRAQQEARFLRSELRAEFRATERLFDRHGGDRDISTQSDRSAGSPQREGSTPRRGEAPAPESSSSKAETAE